MCQCLSLCRTDHCSRTRPRGVTGRAGTLVMMNLGCDQCTNTPAFKLETVAGTPNGFFVFLRFFKEISMKRHIFPLNWFAKAQLGVGIQYQTSLKEKWGPHFSVDRGIYVCPI